MSTTGLGSSTLLNFKKQPFVAFLTSLQMGKTLPQIGIDAVFRVTFCHSVYNRMYFFSFLRKDFSVALEPILELALVDQAGSNSQRSTCFCLLRAGIKDMRHHCLTPHYILILFLPSLLPFFSFSSSFWPGFISRGLKCYQEFSSFFKRNILELCEIVSEVQEKSLQAQACCLSYGPHHSDQT